MNEQDESAFSKLGRGTKKAAKFTFVWMPARILGLHGLRAGNQTIKYLWSNVTSPTCPSCDTGHLQLGHDEVDSSQHLYPWTCASCGYTVLAGCNRKAVMAITSELRSHRIAASLKDMDTTDRHEIIRGHRLQSRIYFMAAALTLIGFFYILLRSSSLLSALNWFAFATLFWLGGMKKSYHAWLVQTNNLFTGSFWQWFKDQKWLI